MRGNLWGRSIKLKAKYAIELLKTWQIMSRGSKDQFHMFQKQTNRLIIHKVYNTNL